MLTWCQHPHVHRGPGSHSPRTRASPANSLQSDLRWMTILVPVLTPEASAISNTPELRHTGEGKPVPHTTTDKPYTAGPAPLPWFSQAETKTDTERSHSTTFSEPRREPRPRALSGTTAAAAWGVGLFCSLRTPPLELYAHLSGPVRGARHGGHRPGHHLNSHVNFSHFRASGRGRVSP